MKILSQIKSLRAAPEVSRGPRIAVFGDSHVAALAQAQNFSGRKSHYGHISLFQRLKDKNGKRLGDITLSGFCREISKYGPDDFIFSAVGGNNYAVVSTVRDRTEYDFLASPSETNLVREEAELVPFRAIANHIESALRGTLGPVLEAIRSSTSAKLFYLAPPPPKEDNSFIAAHFEKRFAQDGMLDLGPTRPDLRLKCWKLQLDCLAEICDELGFRLIMPPAKSVTPAGFLVPQCYAKDVTHGNRVYGDYVLKQISKITRTFDQAKLQS